MRGTRLRPVLGLLPAGLLALMFLTDARRSATRVAPDGEMVRLYDRAIDLTTNLAERRFLIDQRDGMTAR